VDDTHPDIIVATETWLNSTMKDGDIGQPDNFSEKYDIYRCDRKDGYGGVLVAVIKDLSCRENDLETDCEMVWVKVDLKNDQHSMSDGERDSTPDRETVTPGNYNTAFYYFDANVSMFPLDKPSLCPYSVGHSSSSPIGYLPKSPEKQDHSLSNDQRENTHDSETVTPGRWSFTLESATSSD
jgi:hypothetical protein